MEYLVEPAEYVRFALEDLDLLADRLIRQIELHCGHTPETIHGLAEEKGRPVLHYAGVTAGGRPVESSLPLSKLETDQQPFSPEELSLLHLLAE